MAEIKPARTPFGRFLDVSVERLAGVEAVECVRFDVDWGHEWPLWGPCEESYPIEPNELGLSQPLTMQLRTFYDYWVDHFPHGEGWDSLERCRYAHDEADRLTELVATELHGRYVVENCFIESFACTAGLVRDL